MIDLQTLKSMANNDGWIFHCYQKNIGMVSFVRTRKEDVQRINIYLTTMTVATSLNHPKQGKTQLYRKQVNKKLMVKIFKNPRVHTHKGYQRVK